jgi:hypothetical protein
MPDFWKPSRIFRRLENFLLLASEPVVSSSRAGIDFAVEIEVAQQFANALGAHQRVEVVAVLFDLGQIVVFGQQLAALSAASCPDRRRQGFEVQHALDVAQGHVEHHAETARQALQEPDVGGRRGQFDVAHALATHLGQRHFDAALLADHATVLEALVLAAQALVVLDRAEDLGAEQAIALRLEGAVVDGFRLLDFAVGPGTDLVGRGETDGNRVEFFFGVTCLNKSSNAFIVH